MRRLPRSIRIMSVDHAVERHPELLDDEGNGLPDRMYGLYDPDGPTILIAGDQKREREKVTVVHESLHAMLDLGGLADAYDSDEKLVTRLAPILLSWLRENRGAIAYLQERS